MATDNLKQDPLAEEPAMSLQQRRFTKSEHSQFHLYKDLMVGDSSLLFLLGFELYNLIVSPLGTGLGIGIRRILLPYLLKRGSGRAFVGREVTIRQPKNIQIGGGCMLDDFVALDVRSSETHGEAGITIGRHALIGRNTLITTKGGHITLGDATNVSSFCRIATRSKIEIGKSVLIAAYCYIGCGNHSFDDPDRPIIEQEMEVRGGVKIGDNTWIGTRATILDGVTVGKGAIIGAHSLVRTDVPDNAIYAGVPAKFIRYRGDIK